MYVFANCKMSRQEICKYANLHCQKLQNVKRRNLTTLLPIVEFIIHKNKANFSTWQFFSRKYICGICDTYEVWTMDLICIFWQESCWGLRNSYYIHFQYIHHIAASFAKQNKRSWRHCLSWRTCWTAPVTWPIGSTYMVANKELSWDKKITN